MVDLSFQIEQAEPQRAAAEPLLVFKLHVQESGRAGATPTPVHAVVLRCQVRIEPGRRRYTATEQEQLLDLFGTPERWGQTLRPMLWQHVSAVLPPFSGSVVTDLLLPCSFDFSLAATKYFAALQDGDIPLCFLFSGTVFYQSAHDALQVAQIPWQREASFRLPAAIWRALMDTHYPNSAWLCLRQDVFESLRRFKSQQGLATMDQAIEELLDAREPANTAVTSDPEAD